MKHHATILFRLLAICMILSLVTGSALAADGDGNTIFLPVINRGSAGNTIRGQVLTADQVPVAGVTLLTQSGQSVITDGEGKYTLEGLSNNNYTLTPVKPGYLFSPESKDVTLPPEVQQVNFTTALVGCAEGLVNGGFENTTGWQLPITEYTASYSTAKAHNGSWSLRTGIISSADNRYSYSSGWQYVSIPSSASSASLEFWLYSLSSETSTADLPPKPQGNFIQSALGADIQYALVLNQAGQILETLIWQRSDTQAWTRYTFNLIKYRGASVQLVFGTYNDGYNGITSMYTDDVSLSICPGTTTPTPTPVSPPTCGNLLSNQSFETTGSWYIPLTAYPADYSTERAHSGSRSMRNGIIYSSHNKYSYSDARQTVTIPWSATSVTLGLWVYPTSGELLSLALPAKPQSADFGDEALGSDVQYVLVLDAAGAWIDTLLWQRSNSQTWTFHQFDLKKYAGKTISIQFGVYNDGGNGVTSMYVDDITLSTCAPNPTQTPTATVGPSPTATATGTPAACINIIKNGGLENATDWIIPLTAYPADYSKDRAHGGVFSMRTGIVNATHNRYSYSDARQTVTIPSNATSARLGFYVYASSAELDTVPLAAKPESLNFGEDALGSDVQYLLVLDAAETWIDTLVWQRSNTQAWIYHEYDLKKFAGRTIKLQFGVYNDGYNGITSMYYDDVALNICAP